MGKYINHNSKLEPLPTLGKFEKLIEDGAVQIDKPKEWVENLVCVVANGPFEAAAWCYNPFEFAAFAPFDGRPKGWLIYPHVKEVAK